MPRSGSPADDGFYNNHNRDHSAHHGRQLPRSERRRSISPSSRSEYRIRQKYGEDLTESEATRSSKTHDYERDRRYESKDAHHSRLAKFGVRSLNEEDYFQRAAEFKTWLAEGGGKGTQRPIFLDELDGKESRRRFKKFVRYWNDGRLPDSYYMGQVTSLSAPSGSRTRHKWNFSAKYSDQEKQQLELMRDNVDTLTNATSRGAEEARSLERKHGRGRRLRETNDEERANDNDKEAQQHRPIIGPSAPNVSLSSDVQYERELHEEAHQRQRQNRRRAENRSLREEAEDLAPRATGRDATLEKRREKAASNAEFAHRRDVDNGFEIDDDILMGGGRDDSFQNAIMARERNASRRSQAQEIKHNERQSRVAENIATMRAKENDTMNMFKQLAAQRFGDSNGG